MPMKPKNWPDNLDFTDIALNIHPNSKRMHMGDRVPRKNKYFGPKKS